MEERTFDYPSMLDSAFGKPDKEPKFRSITSKHTYQLRQKELHDIIALDTEIITKILDKSTNLKSV